MSLKYLGRGCKTCPVRENGCCDTMAYRGSRCAELRDAVGMDDPEEVTPVNYTYRGVRCTGAQYSVSPTHFFFEKDGKGFEFEYEPEDEFFPVDDLEYAEKAIDAFLEQEARKEATAELQKQLEQYKSVFGDILFPAEPGTAEFEQRREVQENPAGRWMYSDDGFYWKLVPQDTGKIDFSRVMLRKLPDSVFVGVNQDVCMNPEDYLYSFNFGMSWDDLYGCDWIYHSAGRKAWFKRKEEKR